MTIRRFEDIEGWQLVRALSREIYQLAASSPLGRDFSLKDQMLRSSGSIMDNIAEGFDAGSDREFIRFLQYAKRPAASFKASSTAASIKTTSSPKLSKPSINPPKTPKGKSEPSSNTSPKASTTTPSTLPAKPRTTNHEPRTTNREPRTTNREPQKTQCLGVLV